MLPEWSFCWGGPSGQAQFKTTCEDFIVLENLGFEPEGEGEHVFLWIEKRNSNTHWVAEKLAQLAAVPSVAVGLSGQKDRQAVTRQWFSVAIHPTKEPDWQLLNDENIQVLKAIRHPRKLKLGVHNGNKFIIRLRQFEGDRDILESQLENIKMYGFANYFGEQRFGHQGKNILQAEAMFAGRRVKRQQRSMYLSAARSLVFNNILDDRIKHQQWLRARFGDVFMLQGSQSLFDADDDIEILQSRLNEGDIHPTAALWGRGELRSVGEVAETEIAVAALNRALCDGLEMAGLKQERRAVRVLPIGLTWAWCENDLTLDFELPRGAYATSLLREIITWSNSGAA